MYACSLFCYDCTSIGHTLERLWEYQVAATFLRALALPTSCMRCWLKTSSPVPPPCTHTFLTYCSDLLDQGYVPLGTVHRHIAAPSAVIDFQKWCSWAHLCCASYILCTTFVPVENYTSLTEICWDPQGWCSTVYALYNILCAHSTHINVT